MSWSPWLFHEISGPRNGDVDETLVSGLTMCGFVIERGAQPAEYPPRRGYMDAKKPAKVVKDALEKAAAKATELITPTIPGAPASEPPARSPRLSRAGRCRRSRTRRPRRR